MQLRPYQSDAVECMWSYLIAHNDSPCVVIPTGGGKSPVMAAIAQQAVTRWHGVRVLVLAHVRELVAQNADKLRRYWPDAPIGIYSAGLGKRDRYQQIIFASVQSVHGKAMQLGRFDLILVDESHRIPIKGEGMYRAFIQECKRINPAIRVVGLTATPYRLGSGLVCGPQNILNSICYEVGVKELIEQGYLSKLVSKAGLARANLANVHVRGGEYVSSELNRAVNKSELIAAACNEIELFCVNRKAWVIFCASVEHAKAVSAELTTRGIDAPVVEGATKSSERKEIIEKFVSGKLRALCNVNVLSEGFDAPHVDAVILMRPTKSAGLYYQQVGRGLRLADGKTDCLILDFAGNALEHGPIDEIKIEKPKRAGDKATITTMPTKACPKCQAIVVVMASTCTDCNFEFPRSETLAHDATANFAPILSQELDLSKYTFNHRVNAVRYSRHEKPCGTPSLCVTYVCGLRTFKEWVCLEHNGMARSRACDWWRKRLPERIGESMALVPRTIDSALNYTQHLLKPIQITVLERGKFPEIVSHELEPDTSGKTADDWNAIGRDQNLGSVASQPPMPWMRQL